jgi:hypothetical protein
MKGRETRCAGKAFVVCRTGVRLDTFQPTFCILKKNKKKKKKLMISGHAVGKWVQILCYKLEGRGFDFQLAHWTSLNLSNPSSCIMTLR